MAPTLLPFVGRFGSERISRNCSIILSTGSSIFLVSIGNKRQINRYLDPVTIWPNAQMVAQTLASGRVSGVPFIIRTNNRRTERNRQVRRSKKFHVVTRGEFCPSPILLAKHRLTNNVEIDAEHLAGQFPQRFVITLDVQSPMGVLKLFAGL